MTNEDVKRIADYVEQNGNYDGICTIMYAPNGLIKTEDGYEVLGLYVDESHQVSAYATNPYRMGDGYFTGIDNLFTSFEHFVRVMV